MSNWYQLDTAKVLEQLGSDAVRIQAPIGLPAKTLSS
jgi:hypothetical protein